MEEKENKNFILKIFDIIIIPLIVAIISSGTTYYVAMRYYSPPNEKETEGSVAIEAVAPIKIFTFSGGDGSGTFDLSYDSDMETRYGFSYSMQQEGFAGLTFKFEDSADFSNFETISFLLTMPETEGVDLVIKDISGQEIRHRLIGNQQPETQKDIPLSNFSSVNLKAVQEVMFFADTNMLTGNYSLAIKNIQLKE